jgi:transposase
VIETLVRGLRPDNIVIMDNLSSHKRIVVKEKIEAVGAALRFLQLYCPSITRSRKPSRV